MRLIRIEENIEHIVKEKPLNEGKSLDINEMCGDYKLLSDKIAIKEEICNELKENPDKLNTALLIQILKLHKEKYEGERGFAYTNLNLTFFIMVLSITAMVISIISLGVERNLITFEWGIIIIVAYLILALISMVVFGAITQFYKKNRLENL